MFYYNNLNILLGIRKSIQFKNSVGYLIARRSFLGVALFKLDKNREVDGKTKPNSYIGSRKATQSKFILSEHGNQTKQCSQFVNTELTLDVSRI